MKNCHEGPQASILTQWRDKRSTSSIQNLSVNGVFSLKDKMYEQRKNSQPVRVLENQCKYVCLIIELINKGVLVQVPHEYLSPSYNST